MKTQFQLTTKQIEQAKLVNGPARHICAFGGGRSGKTFGFIRQLFIRAICEPQSRHIAARLRFNHAKTSLWYETIPKVIDLCFPGLPATANNSDFFYRLKNGSEIWITGLDEKERVEKVLGKEYATIYFNESSQIPYTSITMALTRLAQKTRLKNRAFYDFNPPTKRHWSYPLFIRKLDPETWEPLKKPEKYDSILMNPVDNIENIDPEYLDLLDQLPEKDQLRFKYGEFGEDSSGSIYYAFDRDKAVAPISRISGHPLIIGMDFNVNPMTATICQVVNDKLHVIDEIWLENSNTYEMAEELKRRYPGSHRVIPDSTGRALKTSSAGISDHEILRRAGYMIPPVQNPFRMDRYNAVNFMLEKSRLIINPKCVKLIQDLEQVIFKEGTNLPDTKVKHLTHISDSLGYVVHHCFPVVKHSSNMTMVKRI